MSDNFDEWHDSLNKMVNAETGKPVTITDPFNTKIQVLTGQELKDSSATDTLAGEEQEVSEPVVITGKNGLKHEI